jgi:ribokinase
MPGQPAFLVNLRRTAGCPPQAAMSNAPRGPAGEHDGAGRVFVVGSVNADYVLRVARFPQPGETVSGGKIEILQGGKGANQAHAAARLGAQVVLIAAIGTDPAGNSAIAELTADGVDTNGLLRCQERTGIAMVLTDATGENMIAVAPGANDMLTAEAVTAGLAGRIHRESVVLASLEVPLAAVQAAASAAAQAGAAMVINPAPGRPLPGELLRGAVLTPNQGEVLLLAPDAADEQAAIGELIAAGAAAVIVTRGERGATLFRPRTEPAHCPAPQVTVVDTVGAGDAFNGALATALAGGLDLQIALEAAVEAGALACTGPGARQALPRATDIGLLAPAPGHAAGMTAVIPR